MVHAIDKQWYRMLAPLSIEVLQYLKSNLHDLEMQKEQFLRREIESPFFDYSHIAIAEIEQKASGLQKLKETIAAEEPHPVVRDLYQAKIDEYLANALLLSSSYTASLHPERAHAAMADFQKANRYLHGALHPEIFNLTLHTLRRKLARVAEDKIHENPEAFAALQKLVQNLPARTEKYEFIVGKRQNADTRFIESADEVESIFNAELQKRGLSDTWCVEVDQTGLLTTFSVISHRRVFAIPGQFFFQERHTHGHYTINKLNGLIAHEIDTHIIRRHNGRRSVLRLLGTGLDRYQRGEEGLATYRAQKVKGSQSFAGFLGHLSVGLALGMEPQGSKKDFAQMFALLRAYFLLIGSCQVREAELRAWHACWRIFRGTTCREKGVVFTKDALYREGNIRIHQLLHEFPEAENDLDVGNFDPTKQTHVEALLSLGILPHSPWHAIAHTLKAHA